MNVHLVPVKTAVPVLMVLILIHAIVFQDSRESIAK